MVLVDFWGRETRIIATKLLYSTRWQRFAQKYEQWDAPYLLIGKYIGRAVITDKQINFDCIYHIISLSVDLLYCTIRLQILNV